MKSSYFKNFSIITVVHNDVSHIIETMNSVLGQTHKQIEYILIDGGSTDGTRENIIEYISSCANITIEDTKAKRHYLEAIHKDYSELTFKFLSEKDKGIYDAMNKGVSLATKEWLNFMNCGDEFYNSEILEKISKENIEKYSVIYGDTLFVYPQNHQQIIPSSIPTSHSPMSFCHQSSFVKTSIAKQNPFNTHFKICADSHLFSQLFHQKYLFKKLDLVIAKFHYDGVSSKPSWLFFKEAIRIGSINHPLFFITFIPQYCYSLIAFYFKTHLPSPILSLIYKIKFGR